jgi:hypothetical protein
MKPFSASVKQAAAGLCDLAAACKRTLQSSTTPGAVARLFVEQMLNVFGYVIPLRCRTLAQAGFGLWL